MKIISVKFPKNPKIQGNYGNLKVQVYSNEEKPKLIEEDIVKLKAIVAGEKKRTIEIYGISGDRKDDQCVISAVVKNTGNILVSPILKIQLRTKENRVIGSTQLEIEGLEKNGEILSDRMATLTGTLSNIKPGKYQAVIKIIDGNNNSDLLEMGIVIK
jgi:hypothetical protein